jgi:hypothetical protein
VIYDITPLIMPKLAGRPHDAPPSSEVPCNLARGDNITLQPVESKALSEKAPPNTLFSRR